jgi:hypothetical protein
LRSKIVQTEKRCICATGTSRISEKGKFYSHANLHTPCSKTDFNRAAA